MSGTKGSNMEQAYSMISLEILAMMEAGSEVNHMVWVGYIMYTGM